MNTASALSQGRNFFKQQAWADAYSLLMAADGESPLEPEDLDLLARAAYITGRDTECAEIWARAHHDFLSRGDTLKAVECAFWLGIGLMTKGQKARGGGWIARAQRLIEDGHHDCAEQGLLLIPLALGCLKEGDAEAAFTHFSRALAIGRKFHNPDLTTLGRLGCGQALIRQDRIEKGMALLDEAMAAVEADEVSSFVTGLVYCAVIETCQDVYDLRRAREWTEALSHWCSSQPDVVPYRGQCLVRRAEIMQLQGAWPDAMTEAKRACDQLTRPPGEPAAGLAFYRQAELLRLRGKFPQAEKTYRQASKWGRKPQPGLALLRLAQGQVDTARTAIERVLEEVRDRMTRAGMLPVYVEIMLAADDIKAARAASDELSAIAAEFDIPYLRAVATHARGAVLLAEENVRAALDSLRQAWKAWDALEAPYESARVRVLIGIACRKYGDEDSAEMEFDAARWAFRQLEAAPDLNRVDALARDTADGSSHGLTPRELQVLRRIATGKTNRDIAIELFISERTVDRHVSNILSKLNTPSRTAATAYAYEHKLI